MVRPLGRSAGSTPAVLTFLATASVSAMGYDHGLDEPVIRLLNDARRLSIAR